MEGVVGACGQGRVSFSLVEPSLEDEDVWCGGFVVFGLLLFVPAYFCGGGYVYLVPVWGVRWSLLAYLVLLVSWFSA